LFASQQARESAEQASSERVLAQVSARPQRRGLAGAEGLGLKGLALVLQLVLQPVGWVPGELALAVLVALEVLVQV
jgi:hypothetical protein